jgi:hypothetical protein
LILRELERAVLVSTESKGVAECRAVPVDYEEDRMTAERKRNAQFCLMRIIAYL